MDRAGIGSFVCAALLLTQAPLYSADTTPVWSWIADTDLRVYPSSFSRRLGLREIDVCALRNERVHAQIGVRAERDVEVALEAIGFSAENSGPLWAVPVVRISRWILVDEDGQLTPDVLIPSDTLRLRANTSRSFWLTWFVPADADTGVHGMKLVVHFKGVQADTYRVRLKVLPFALPDPAEYRFHLNVWQDPAALARWHGVELWSEEHWELIGRYAQNLAAHGQKSATTTILDDPWDAQTGHPFPSMVLWKYPGEWNLRRTDRFSFDFSLFDRYVETLEKAGVRQAIHAYSIVYGPGGRNDCRITYLDTRSRKVRQRRTTVGDPWYMAAWRNFLPQFVTHLRQKGWLEKTFLGMDEKPDEILEVILPLVREAAPGLKVALAGYGGKYIDAVDDFSISYQYLLAPQGGYRLDPERRRSQGKVTTFYVAVGPIRPNTFLFSPLFESRILPWIADAVHLDGFLRWAYNSWPDGMWEQPFYRWHSGDMFLVYPGDAGPWDSMRWEMLHQGIQDVEALRLARELLRRAQAAGVLGEQEGAALSAQLERANRLATRQYLDPSAWYPQPAEARHLVNEVLERLARRLGP